MTDDTSTRSGESSCLSTGKGDPGWTLWAQAFDPPTIVEKANDDRMKPRRDAPRNRPCSRGWLLPDIRDRLLDFLDAITNTNPLHGRICRDETTLDRPRHGGQSGGRSTRPSGGPTPATSFHVSPTCGFRVRDESTEAGSAGVRVMPTRVLSSGG